MIHYRIWQKALKYGLLITKIHRILTYKQSFWLKAYIDHNAPVRQASTNAFEKNFFKLISNACFGKTMESVRKRKNIKLCSSWEGRGGLEALISKPNFHSSVLELSKTLLYSFHYEKMPKMLNPSQYKFLFTDTNSFIYWIHCPNINDIVKNHYEFLDTSAFKPGNWYGIKPRNKLVVGLMKDEATGEIITEFVGLRSKMYSIRLNGKDYIKRCKGIKQAIVKRTLSFDDYKTSLDQDCIISRTQRNFVSRLHGVNTVDRVVLLNE